MHLILFLILCSQSFQVISAAPNKSVSDCGSTVSFDHCPASIDRGLTEKITCLFEPHNCRKKDPISVTVILDLGNSTNRPQKKQPRAIVVYVIQAFTVDRDTEVVLYCIAKALGNDNKEYEITTTCETHVIAAAPVAYITFGKERQTTANEALSLDASNSRSMDTPSGTHRQLALRWSCAKVSGPGDCPPSSQLTPSLMLAIPGNYISDIGTVLDFTLFTTSSFGITSNFTQRVTIVGKQSELLIMCVNNCVPRYAQIIPSQKIILNATCFRFCVRPKKWKWSVASPTETLVEGEDFETHGSALTILAGKTQGGNIYTAKVELDGQPGLGTHELVIPPEPYMGNCYGHPSNGIAMETKFSIKCISAPPNVESVRASLCDSDDNRIVLSQGAHVEDLIFELPADPTVKLTVTLAGGIVAVLDVKNFNVTEATNITADELLEKLGDKMTEAEDNFEKKNYDQVIQAMVNVNHAINTKSSMEPVKFENFKNENNLKQLKMLDIMPIDSVDDIEQISQVIASIVDSYDEINVEVIQKATELCKQISEQYNFKLASDDDVPYSNDQIVNSLASCSTGIMKPNYDILPNDTQIEGVPPTSYPMLTTESPFAVAFVEHYPDYSDGISTVQDECHRILLDMEEICYTNGQLLLKGMIDGEAPHRSKKSSLNITVFKNVGTLFSKTPVVDVLIKIRASQDFDSSHKSQNVVVCATNDNAFWWHNNETLTTPLVFLKFNNKESTFQKPFVLMLKRFSNETFESYKEEYVYNGMISYRIGVPNNYIIQFNDIGTENYTVLVTDFIKPTLEELKMNGVIINSTNHFIFQQYNKSFHSWQYLNVLKEEGMPTPNITVGRYGCYKWNKDLMEWKFACASSNKSHEKSIFCLCHEASIFKGQYDYLPIKVDSMEFLDFDVHVDPTYIIFTTTIIIMILFYILLLCVYMKTNNYEVGNNVLFLTDVPNYCKFAYLIVVHTDKKVKSGTTSNIMIKLVGTKSSSKEHVLNYPDPGRQLLQEGNEDWLILASEHYLGDLKEIHLWFDSIGEKPDWSCRNIEIYDLQSDQCWMFTINKRLSLSLTDNVLHVAEPDKYTSDVIIIKKRKIRRLKELCNRVAVASHFWSPIRNAFYEFSDYFRLITIYSIIVSIMFVCICFYGLPTFDKSDALEPHDGYHFSQEINIVGFVSSLIVFIIHSPLVLLYKHHARKRNLKKEHFCRPTIWILLCVNLVIQNSLLLVFGFWVPVITSYMWLTSCGMALLYYIIFFENIIKIIAYKKMEQYSLRPGLIKEKYSDLLDAIESQRKEIYKRFGHLGLRPFLLHLYSPIESEEIIEKKSFLKDRIRALELLQDLIMFSLYILILYMLILANRDKMTIYNNQAINSIIKGEFDLNTDISNVATIKDVNHFIKNVLIEGLQSPTWYSYYTINNPGYSKDKHNSIIGIGRFRQHRVTHNSCTVPNNMKYLKVACTPSYHKAPEFRNFTKHWSLKGNVADRLQEIWKHLNASFDGSSPYKGHIFSYPKGGYTGPLGRTYRNSHINWKYMTSNKWVDNATRALIFEILFYNVNSNLFSEAAIFFEIGPEDFVTVAFKTVTARLLFVNQESNSMTTVATFAFMVVLVLFSLKIATNIIMRRKVLFRTFNFWLLIDVIIIILSFGTLALTQHRAYLVKNFLAQIEISKHNSFIEYFNLFKVETYLTYIAAFLVGTATIRLWKLLRFMIVFRIMERTVLLSIKPICALLVWHFIILLMFTYPGVILFGQTSKHFKSITDTVITLLLCFIGQNGSLDPNKVFRNQFQQAYYMSYMIVSISISAIYVSIVIISYQQAQRDFSNIEQYTLKEYLIEKWGIIWELIRFRCRKTRVRGGSDTEPKIFQTVYPKADEHRYAKCISITKQRMEQMNLIVQCILKNEDLNYTLSKEDVELINKTIYAFHSEEKDDEKDLFFLDNLDDNKVKVIDDYKMLKMEQICSMILDTEEQRKQKEERKQIELREKALRHHEKQLDYLREYLTGLDRIVTELTIKYKKTN